jgi:uncharacterized protein YkwD
LRKLAAAVLAVPVVALLYIPVLLRRSIVARLVLGIGVGGALALGAIGISQPAEIAARPPTVDVPFTSAAFRTDLRTGQAPDAGVQIAFSTPMDERSVAAALSVEPATSVELAWNDDRTVLTIAPRGTWRTATFHTITVGAGALASSGRPLTVPARAAFLTRPAAGATIVATATAGDRIRLDSAFVIEFDRAVDAATLGELVRIQPAVAGSFERTGRRTGGDRFLFTPTSPLAADTAYRLTLAATIRDTDGARIEATDAMTVRTAVAPSVVRFRPANGTIAVPRRAATSVRFTQPMDPTTTAKAFTATVDGKPVAGKITFAEGGTVLVFQPAAAFDYSRTVTIAVATTATSVHGVPLAKSASGAFTTETKPAPPKPKPAASSATSPPSAGGGSWTAVEAWYLRLMNCTRTGGWVTSTGACSSPGGRSVAPLKLDAGISSRVSRPYAKRLATSGACSHFIGGSPADRLRAAGYTGYAWAENLGCRSGSATSAVLGSHLFFQSEKPYNGGHYVNIMSTKYDRVGIGVWASGGRVRLVVDFYRPR